MSVSDLTQLITTVGFPIVCCGALFYNTMTTQKELTNAINNMNDNLTRILEHVKEDDEI